MSVPNSALDSGLAPQESDVVVTLSNLSIQPSSDDRPGEPPASTARIKRAKLNLFQPLADPDTLQVCRNRDSLTAYRPDDSISNQGLSHEMLAIQPLSRAWRQTLAHMPPFEYLTFDLTLPKHTHPGIFWDCSMPTSGGEAPVGICGQNATTLVTTLATATKMRAAGGEVDFELVYDESERISGKMVEFIRRQLNTLAGMHPPVPREGLNTK